MNNNIKNQTVIIPSFWIPIRRVLLSFVFLAFYLLILGIFFTLFTLNTDYLLGLILLVMAFTFFVNGMSFLGKIGSKFAGFLNLLAAIFVLLPALQLYFFDVTIFLVLIVAFSLLFLMFAGIEFQLYVAEGLGWYCLFAFIVFIWYGYHFFSLTQAVPAIAGVKWFGVFCLAWALLVIIAFLALSMGKPIATTVGWLFIIEAILTLLIPGMILLTDKWNPLGGVPG